MPRRRIRASRRSVTAVWVAVAVFAAVAVYVATHPALHADADRPGGDLDSATVAAALAQLDDIPLAGERADGYERDAFGAGWRDPDRNGCDARNDILGRDLDDVVTRPGTHGCVVESGVLDDPCTGAAIAFQRGDGTSELVQIDHIVPLSWAWGYGASAWTEEERMRFANDPVNLVAVDGAANAAKSDSGPSEWMPRRGWACEYAIAWVGVLGEYELSAPAGDLWALERVLEGCG